MSTRKQVSISEFLTGLEKLPVSPMFRFAKNNPKSSDDHDRIFLICTQGPDCGAHLGRTCVCCNDNTTINPYENFKESISEEQYRNIKELLFDFAYTDLEHKAIN